MARSCLHQTNAWSRHCKYICLPGMACQRKDLPGRPFQRVSTEIPGHGVLAEAGKLGSQPVSCCILWINYVFQLTQFQDGGLQQQWMPGWSSLLSWSQKLGTRHNPWRLREGMHRKLRLRTCLWCKTLKSEWAFFATGALLTMNGSEQQRWWATEGTRGALIHLRASLWHKCLNWQDEHVSNRCAAAPYFYLCNTNVITRV